jgi:tetratricopeptide (TPR) repeat protein
MQVLSKSRNRTDKERSIKYFNELIQSNNYVNESLFGLALTYYSINRYDTAREYAEEMLRQSPDNAQV